MTVLDYILDGLEAELALERELGVRTVACDRALLAVAAGTDSSPCGHAGRVTLPNGGVSREGASARSAAPTAAPPASANQTLSKLKSNNLPSAPATAQYDFVFLHHRDLSPAGVEMMGKIVAAMGKTPETAPILLSPPVPKAKAVVVLGGLALKKFYPKLKGGPGEWRVAEDGTNVLITFSPEYVLRYKSVTSGVVKIKREMWLSLKVVMQRTKGG